MDIVPPKIDDRVAVKKTPDKRSKWKYGEIISMRSARDIGSIRLITVQYDKDSGGRHEELPLLSNTNPQVLVFPPDSEVPTDVMGWCLDVGVLPIRDLCDTETSYLFVGKRPPHDTVYAQERSIANADLKFTLRDWGAEEALGGVWSNTDFELENSEVDILHTVRTAHSEGVREIERPENYEPEWR